MRQRVMVVVLVCVSVCYHISSNIAYLYVTTMTRICFVGYAQEYYKFVKKLRSVVTASFTFCDIHSCYCSELLLDSRMTQHSALLGKANDG